MARYERGVGGKKTSEAEKSYTVRTDTETESEIWMYRPKQERELAFRKYSSFTWRSVLHPLCIVRSVVRERDRDRERDRQTDKHRETERQRERDRQTDKHRETDTHTHRHKHRNREREVNDPATSDKQMEVTAPLMLRPKRVTSQHSTYYNNR